MLSPYGFLGGRCLHNSDKAYPGNSKFDLTHSSHACLWRPGESELQEKKKKKTASPLHCLEMRMD